MLNLTNFAVPPPQWVAHSERVFSTRNLLLADECAALIELAEQRGFGAATVRTDGGPQVMSTVRNNERAQFEAPEWIALVWQRMAAMPLPALEGEVALGLPKQLRFYKYSPGQRFRMHKDGPWHEDGLTSKLTLLVYLNEGFAGGETDFRTFGIVPKVGSGLLFIHHTWHEGAAVTEGVKYVLRSDVMYGMPGINL
ncbi:2OG-Fe(II) oxygenase [Rhizobacter sp. SG703]|uniref:prolyl hydroxylase family protein n=1 Tax=Rhizobacter sp. SG703 TaxID=2587140 RepID=UPI00180C031F|nr:2OG-Fe(II) oxygenase [Rhizobacter sp. SG703]NKI93552.1 putative 2-oxoglutarate/Fe(II)-dependent dioxygenase YbiX [Rhizobacter sp. SG703]